MISVDTLKCLNNLKRREELKLSEDDFELMLEAAWSAFENTLFLWGVTQEEIDSFISKVEKQDGYYIVDVALSEVIELED